MLLFLKSFVSKFNNGPLTMLIHLKVGFSSLSYPLI